MSDHPKTVVWHQKAIIFYMTVRSDSIFFTRFYRYWYTRGLADLQHLCVSEDNQIRPRNVVLINCYFSESFINFRFYVTCYFYFRILIFLPYKDRFMMNLRFCNTSYTGKIYYIFILKNKIMNWILCVPSYSAKTLFIFFLFVLLFTLVGIRAQWFIVVFYVVFMN